MIQQSKAVDTSHAPAQTVVAVRCKKCKTTLGMCNDKQLHIGGAVFDHRIHFKCVKCGNSRMWYPSPTFDVVESNPSK